MKMEETSFSNLTDLYPSYLTMLNTQQLLALSIITITTSCLSILGSSSIILCSVFRRRVCFTEVFPIFQLSLADLFASAMMVTGAALYLMDPTNPLELGNDNAVCSYITVITKNFFISTFLLTMTYAAEALIRIRERLHRCPITITTTYSWRIALYAGPWLLPLGITVLLLGLSNVEKTVEGARIIIPGSCTLCVPLFHYNEEACWDNREDGPQWQLAYTFLFMIPLVLVMVGNVILYVFILRTYRRTVASRGLLGYQQHKESLSVRNQTILYESVFVFCWLPSLILGLISLFTPASEFNMGSYYWLYIIQAATAPLQGFFNSVIYGWRREQFKMALSEGSNLLSTNSYPGSYLSLEL